jgi:BirA family biotin operon repressor/biotin-[acetyl-CoA-carboxylase] ligase
METTFHTRFIGHQLIELSTVGSTNKYAAERLALSELRHGAVILAHEQTEGRGQRDRDWISAPDLDLTFSIVLLPERLKAGEQWVLGRLSALAVHDVVHALQPADVKVKWPNDILVGKRKVAGILIKNEVAGSMIVNSIIGIGVNVNNTALSNDLNATSLRLVTGRPQDRMEILEHICTAFEGRWTRWEEKGEGSEEEYGDALWARNRWVDMELDGMPVKARPLDVDDDGRLIVELEDGRTEVFGLDRLRFAPRG